MRFHGVLSAALALVPFIVSNLPQQAEAKETAVVVFVDEKPKKKKKTYDPFYFEAKTSKKSVTVVGDKRGNVIVDQKNKSKETVTVYDKKGNVVYKAKTKR